MMHPIHFRIPLLLALAACAPVRPAAPPQGARSGAADAREEVACVVRSIGVLPGAAARDTANRGSPAQGGYAADAPWYLSNETIPEHVWPAQGSRGEYVKFGYPRVVATDSLVPLSTYRGVDVYAERDRDGLRYGAIYLPVRPGCWFQPYVFVGVGVVRGR